MMFRDIPNQPGYQCDDGGRIYSVKSGAPVAMSLFKRGRQGHLGVNLTHAGKYRMHSVHRLVALAWIGPPPSASHVVMHLDHDPANNQVSNLAYGLPRENSGQMVLAGRSRAGIRTPWHKLNNESVREIRDLMKRGVALRLIAGQFGVGTSTVYDIKRGHTWRNV